VGGKRERRGPRKKLRGTICAVEIAEYAATHSREAWERYQQQQRRKKKKENMGRTRGTLSGGKSIEKKRGYALGRSLIGGCFG